MLSFPDPYLKAKYAQWVKFASLGNSNHRPSGPSNALGAQRPRRERSPQGGGDGGGGGAGGSWTVPPRFVPLQPPSSDTRGRQSTSVMARAAGQQRGRSPGRGAARAGAARREREIGRAHV